ncbi:MAG TPA: dioxygenase, partial [Quisquiliibacterium sp.]|nr:dioxygenase [Quisquiliibacterium sp.]
GQVLGCTEGRSTATWVDFDLHGHQLSLHLGEPFATTLTGHVGDHLVPMPHFGLILALPAWQAFDAHTRATMRFDVPCALVFDPRREERLAWPGPVPMPWEPGAFVGAF